MKQPSFQFYPADWLNDINLRRASFEEKGFLIDIMCLMHQSQKYGYILKEIEQDLPQLLGKDRRTFNRLLAKVSQKSLISRNSLSGELFNKRMVRDEEIRAIRRESGKKGAEILLRQKCQQNIPPSSSSSSSSSSSNNKKKIKKKKIFNGESDRGKNIAFDGVLDYCRQKKVFPALGLESYEDIDKQYRQKVNFWPEVKACIDYCFDNGIEIILANRLRNWMKNRIKWDKEKELKNLTERQDKIWKDVVMKKNYKPPVDIDMAEDNLINPE